MLKKMYVCEECDKEIGDYVEPELRQMVGRFPNAKEAHFCSSECREVYMDRYWQEENE
jgi:uncharacterized protein with PIN domain